MSKKPAAAPKAKVELYDKLVSTNPQVERKGATMPYTSINGHMFSFLSANGKMGLRLSAGEREAFIQKFDTALCEQHGRVMKDFVEVPDGLLQNTDKLRTYFDMSHDYTGSLKPKPSAKG